MISKIYYSNCIVTFICLFCTITLNAQHKNQHINKYNRWELPPQSCFWPFYADTTNTYNSFKTFAVHCPYINGTIGISFPMFHLDRDYITVDIKTKYKAERGNVFFTIHSIGMDCNVISADTLSLPVNKDWTELTYSVPVKCEYSLEFCIEVNAEDTEENIDKDTQVDIAYLDISCGEVPLDEIATAYIPHALSASTIKRWGDFLSSPLMDKKILALGETLHGTQTMSELELEIIKERVINHNCKLILLEIPLSLGLILNRYVKNDPHFSSFDFIKKSLSEYLVDYMIVLQWIKDYNKLHNNEVSVLGLDYEYSRLSGRMYMLYFLDRANNEHKYDSLILHLLDDTRYPQYDIEPNNIIIHDKELELVLQSINNNKEYKDFDYKIIFRDEKMAENTQMICNMLLDTNSTATILEHFLHANYIGAGSFIHNSISMGHLLKDVYQSDYSCVALTTKQGDAWFPRNIWDMRVSLLPIKEAIEGSLEYEMDKLKGDSVTFVQTASLPPNVPYSMRTENAYYSDKKEFGYYIPYKFMDGIICTNQSHHLNTPPNPLGDSFLFDIYDYICNKYLKKEK